MTAANCPYGDESLIVADYLAGRLSETKGRAFEAHSFGCDRCFGELQRATELRAADGSGAARADDPEPSSAGFPIGWRAVGLAATIALAIGIWVVQPLNDPAEEPGDAVYRDGISPPANGGLALEVSRHGDTVALTWPAVQRADRYVVRIWSEAGDPVLEQETSEPSLELAVSRWRDTSDSDHFYVQVVAMDELQQPIARSDFLPL